MEHKDKITDLESEVTDLKDLVDQHRDTFNSKFVSTVKPEFYSFYECLLVATNQGTMLQKLSKCEVKAWLC